MKKIGLLIKQEAEEILRGKLEDSDSVLLVGYSGLSACQLNVLRSSLSEIGSLLFVIKNSVARRLFGFSQEFQTSIIGPCGLIFVGKDLISTTRLVYDFAKQNTNLEIKLGLLRDRVIRQEELKALSRIFSLSALHSQVVAGLKFPITRIIFSLKQILNKLVWVLSQIKDKKQ